MRARPSALLVTCALLGLAGCGDDDDPAPREAAAPLPVETTSQSAPPSTPTTPPAPATTTAPTTTAPSATPTATASASATFPPQADDLEQGGTYYAVYLAVARTERFTPELEAAGAAAAEVGFEATTGDVDCDRGAREALRLARTGTYFGTSVFFDTAAQAKQFVQAYEPGVVGTAKVQAFCMD